MSIITRLGERFTETVEKISPYVHDTPVLTSKTLNEISGANLYFKCENFQKVGAFKMRGAMNAILSIPKEELEKGVATHSSGNFAQALALAAKNLGVKAYIVMPSNATQIKKDAVKGYGGEIIECEPTLQARETTLNEVVDKTGAKFIHPYNDEDVILGQGTATYELINYFNENDITPDCFVVPVGGGGLVSGAIIAAKKYMPSTLIIGAEPMNADDAFLSFHSGNLIPAGITNTIADGLRTSLGEINFEIIKEGIREIVRVEEHDIVEAMRLIWDRMKIVVEPSSAVTLAAVLKAQGFFAGKNIGLIISGGNVDVSDLPFNK